MPKNGLVMRFFGYARRGVGVVGELWHIAICNDTAREFVRFAQIPALMSMKTKEC